MCSFSTCLVLWEEGGRENGAATSTSLYTGAEPNPYHRILCTLDCLLQYALIRPLACTFICSPSPPVDISVPPQSHELRENDMVTLDCSTNGVITHWLLDNTRLTTGDGIMMSGSSIMFSAFKFSQAGEYRCVAASAHGALVSFPGSLTYFGEPVSLLANYMGTRYVCPYKCVHIMFLYKWTAWHG